MSQEVALARVEEKLDRVLERLDEQSSHNGRFYETRDKVNRMEANARGAWWILGVLGIMVSSAVSWIVAAIRS